jgi:hypothetical protein
MEGKLQEVGYGKPPVATRFKKGQSGNPRGRPKVRRKGIPYDALLGQMVTIRDGGKERRITAAEAFLLHLTKKGLEGDSPSARASLAAIEAARAKHTAELPPQSVRFVLCSVTPGSVGCSLEPLGIATKRNRYSDHARYELKPWIVQAALDRMGDRRLTREEQTIVVQAVRSPEQVIWPTWWLVQPWTTA